MAYDRFLIGPFTTGLQQDLKRFLLAEDAFYQMNNAFVFRGRVKKRFGSLWTGSPRVPNNSRLRIQVGTTDGSGNFVSAGLTTPVTFAIGQQFSVGTALYTVYQAAGGMLATVGTGTFTVASGAINIAATGANSTLPVYIYPSQPVMGLILYENGPINNQPAVAFDMQNPYIFTGTAWSWMNGATQTPEFTGNNNTYFWASNWRGITADQVALFVTNNKDPIWYYYYNTGASGYDWNQFNPAGITSPVVNTQFNSNGDYVYTALIVLPFQGHLVILNTTEQIIGGAKLTYTNRCRFSAYGSPFATGSWLIPGQSYGGTNPFGGGFVDAATKEAIVGAEFIKDRLIVYFETSTWELAYTGNQVLPFTWQKINTELGAVGTFSTVPFDKAVLGIGKTGVHACSGANVERIDQKIPDQVFQFEVKNNSYNRIWGVRVYQPEIVVWSFLENGAPSSSNFTNKVMVYNYENQTWSFNDDCITCYGYFEQQSDLTWAAATFPWEDATFEWDAYVEPAQLRQVIFGNQQGFVCLLEPDIPRNASNMIVTNITNSGTIWTFTVYNHNFAQGDYFLIENNISVEIDLSQSSGIFQIYALGDSTGSDASNKFIVDTDLLSFNPSPGFYTGEIVISRVSQVDIISKQWNPYLQTGLGIYLAKISFAVSATNAASIQVYYNSDDSNDDFVDDSGPTGTNALMGTSTLDLYAYPGFDTEGAARFWHPVYFQGQGNCVQIRIMYNDSQMLDANSSLEEFEIESMILQTMRGVIKGI